MLEKPARTPLGGLQPLRKQGSSRYNATAHVSTQMEKWSKAKMNHATLQEPNPFAADGRHTGKTGRT